jgi:hypothetical protein
MDSRDLRVRAPDLRPHRWHPTKPGNATDHVDHLRRKVNHAPPGAAGCQIRWTAVFPAHPIFQRYSPCQPASAVRNEGVVCR